MFPTLEVFRCLFSTKRAAHVVVGVPNCKCVLSDLSDQCLVSKLLDLGREDFQVSSEEAEHPVHLGTDAVAVSSPSEPALQCYAQILG